MLTALAALVMSLALGMTGCTSKSKTQAPSAQESSALQLGKRARPAHDFELKTADGQKVRLASFQGKVILLHFWASWCAPCVTEFPAWLKFMKRWEGKGVEGVAVSLDQSWKDAHKIAPTHGLPSDVTVLLDSEETSSDLYGTYQFPETYVIGKDFTIADKWVGSQDWSDPEIAKRIEELTKE